MTRAKYYVTNLHHCLDDKGAIAPESGPARKLAEFLTAVVAHATDFDRPEQALGPPCFKCRKRRPPTVETLLTDDGLVVWRCVTCDIEGEISGWEGTFWDLGQGNPPQ